MLLADIFGECYRVFGTCEIGIFAIFHFKFLSLRIKLQCILCRFVNLINIIITDGD